MSETSYDHDRRIIGAGSKPIKPKTRAYNPEAAFGIGGRFKVEHSRYYLRWCPSSILDLTIFRA